MRTSLATLAAVLMLAGSGVYAQQAPVRTEGPFSPFTYERLGATPSIRLPWAAKPADSKAAEAKAQAALKSPAAISAQDAARATAARAETPLAPVAVPTAAPAQ
jgi:hypothetical protein